VLLHDALRRFFETYRGRSIADVPRDELRLELRRACDGVFDAYERRLPPLNPKLWRIERRTLGILLERVVDDEVELQRRLGHVRVTPRFLELAFGMPRADSDPSSSAEPLVLARDVASHAGEAIRIRGQIDRVDASADGRLIAYDYKSSAGPRPIDMREGRDLQLAVYLLAVERLFAAPGHELAGGGYYALRPLTSRRNNGIYREALHAYTDIRRTCESSFAEAEWHEFRRQLEGNLWTMFDRIRDGDFRIVPSLDETTCTYCDYKRVCRFDRQRIQAKRRADEVPNDRPLRPAVRRADEPAAISDSRV
jgi:hypothetical protein